MKERIKFLIQLQDCDNQIQEVIDRKREGPLIIHRLESELKSNEVRFQEDYDKLEFLKKDRRQVEQEIQDLEIKAKKSDLKLTLIKSNKEYSALLKEIEELKKIKFLTEDKAIEIMESIEELETRCQNNKNQLAKLKMSFEQAKKKMSNDLQDLDVVFDELEKKRGALCETVDQELLSRYHFIKDRKAGQAVSSVIKGVCQTCHLEIPPQKFNELIKGHTFMTCPNCNRIIYWGEDESFKEVFNMN